jgi:hypothetical protein
VYDPSQVQMQYLVPFFPTPTQRVEIDGTILINAV